MLTLDFIKNEIKTCLNSDPSVENVILFGSYAKGNPNEDSDIDLLVLLNEKGINGNYRERMDRSLRIYKLLYPVRKKINVDVIVYTYDEWDFLLSAGSPFLKDIKDTGIYIQ